MPARRYREGLVRYDGDAPAGGLRAHGSGGVLGPSHGDGPLPAAHVGDGHPVAGDERDGPRGTGGR
ncbi:hypothetical protein [Streptomyces sp. NPDC093094]|uniref:hypothetical protein n=1 Tax=Streptomyces sp. NPDC093094 TaxID=3366026 RepID=UPI00380E6BA8